MVIAGLGCKYASTYDASFYWKYFSNRLDLIKTNGAQIATSIKFSYGFIFLDWFSCIIENLQYPCSYQ